MTILGPWAGMANLGLPLAISRGLPGPLVAPGPSVARLAPFLIQTLKGNDQFGALGREKAIRASRGVKTLRGYTATRL